MADTNETAQIDGAEAGQQDERLYGVGAWNTVQAHMGISSSNPGPKNADVIRLAPNSDCPPATDHGSVGSLWHSFELTHRRVQKGGWTH
jgi:oxalate decarboxylase